MSRIAVTAATTRTEAWRLIDASCAAGKLMAPPAPWHIPTGEPAPRCSQFVVGRVTSCCQIGNVRTFPSTALDVVDVVDVVETPTLRRGPAGPGSDGRTT